MASPRCRHSCRHHARAATTIFVASLGVGDEERCLEQAKTRMNQLVNLESTLA